MVARGTKTLLFSITMMACLIAERHNVIPSSKAADGPFSAVIPYQYDLPVDFHHEINIYSTYGEYYPEDGMFIDGTNVKIPTTDVFVNVQRFIQAFKIPGINNVGFATQEIIPLTSVQRTGLSKSGIGDPLFEPVMFWFKPTKNLTLGLSDYISIPIGGSEFTNHDWQNYLVPFYDYNLYFEKHQSINIDGQLGLISPTKQNFTSAPSVDPGSTYFATFEIAYKGTGVFHSLHPYFAMDYQNVNPSTYANGTKVANALEGSDLAVGGGLQYMIGHRYEFSVSFRRTVSGHTFVPTGNQIYYHFTYIW